MSNAYATASVLVISILAINLLAYWLMQRFVAKGGRHPTNTVAALR
jgi:ABC-type phosphate transport system permease subunit